MSIKINNPCPENWANMSPSQQGKFCQQCQKEVVDFTQLSTTEIEAFFQEERKGICGRFENRQLEALASTPSFPTPSRMRKWAAAAVLTAVVTVSSCGDTADSEWTDWTEPWLWEESGFREPAIMGMIAPMEEIELLPTIEEMDLETPDSIQID